ncbi:unnamed protein product [Somion occarium]|uniref:F-box domain-containing protein n=1 Tax=Somion occarium TaxID=3059160 RepID=A0ABP1E0R7_9APHY
MEYLRVMRIFLLISFHQHEDAIGELERIIMYHRQAIASYKGRQNVIVPCINAMLPPEVMAHVFLQRVLLGYEPSFSGEFYSWLTVAHVCRHWSNVVASTPHLFSYIGTPISNLNFLQQVMFYSKQTQLDMVIKEDEYCMEFDMWKLLVAQLPRTRSLELFCSPSITTWPICPFLTSLHWKESPSSPAVLALARDLHRLLPNLRELETDAQTFGDDWYFHPVPSSLRSLSISHDRPFHSINDVVARLQTLPLLESLKLKNLKDSCGVPLHDSTPLPSSISHLKSVTLNAGITLCSAVLEQIVSFDSVNIGLYAELRSMENIRTMQRNATGLFRLATSWHQNCAVSMGNRVCRSILCWLRHPLHILIPACRSKDGPQEILILPLFSMLSQFSMCNFSAGPTIGISLHSRSAMLYFHCCQPSNTL